MTRPLRIEYENAVHHVMSRGIDGQPIVCDDEDRARWLACLAAIVRRFDWRLFAFTLMDNHFHLFLQTPGANLSLGMRELNGNFALYYNRRRGRRGPLFQDRFKSLLVQEEGYFLTLSRYIHLNPVRAGLVACPGLWRWGSCPGYYRKRDALPWIDYETVFGEYSNQVAHCRRRYRLDLEAELSAPTSGPMGEVRFGGTRYEPNWPRAQRTRRCGA